MRQHPWLIVSAGDLERVRAFARTRVGESILHRLDWAMSQPMDGITVGSHAVGHATRFLLTSDPVHAANAREVVERTIAGVPYRDSPPLWSSDYKMIFRTKAAVDVALAYDLLWHAWPAEFRGHVAVELARKAREFAIGGGTGFNDKPHSNWTGNTASAAGFIALSVLEEPGAAETLAMAREKFFRYVGEAFGDGGWCCEGFNYLRYPLTTSGFAFMQALARHERRDIIRGTHLEGIMPLYLQHLVGTADGPYVPFFGLNYNQSDVGRTTSYTAVYERTRWRSGDLVMGLGSALPEHAPAIVETWRRVFGDTGDRTHDIFKPADAFFALANLARAPEPAPPAQRIIADRTLGYYALRNRFADHNDIIVAISLSARPRPGTYSFQDAGSFRLYGLGTRWAEQKSRADSDWSVGISRELENVVQVGGTNGWPGGVPLYAEVADDVVCIGADLSPAYSLGSTLRDAGPSGIKATRHFACDLTGMAGCPALVVIVDSVRQAPAKPVWTMHTAAEPEIVNAHTVILRGRGGARLHLSFQLPVHLSIVRGVETHTVCATVEDPRDAVFVAVMVLVDGGSDWPVVVAENALAWRVGKRIVRFDGQRLRLNVAPAG